MASRSSLPEQDLTCPVCMDIFTDPVLLKCSHSFCNACLHKCWKENKAGECPICRAKTTEHPTCNRVLKNLCEAFLKHRIEKPASTSESLCSFHGERLKIFCLNDEELICVICQTSEKHENHKLRPVKEAVLKNKEEIDGTLRVLQEKLEAFNEEKQKNNQAAEFLKSQAECTVIQIQKEFEKLHQFLRDEEEARIAALWEEEEEKSQRMKERVEEMTKEISSLTKVIRALEQEMRADDTSFLQKYKVTKKRAQYKVSDPEKVSGERIDVAKHLGNLKYRVWEKMQGIVQYMGLEPDPESVLVYLLCSCWVGLSGRLCRQEGEERRMEKMPQWRSSRRWSRRRKRWNKSRRKRRGQHAVSGVFPGQESAEAQVLQLAQSTHPAVQGCDDMWTC